MRIVSGRFRARRLVAPRGLRTRPTADKVRQALFNLVDPSDGEVLDLYAGTGAVGLEALSRGALRTTFIEHDPMALRALHANIEALGLGQAEAIVLPVPVDRGLSRLTAQGRIFDLVFADPPYAEAEQDLPSVLERIEGILAPHGVLVFEHRSNSAPPEDRPGLRRTSLRRYGDASLSIFEWSKS